MNYKQSLEKIKTDERFASYQNFDPELLQSLEYYYELPLAIRHYCSEIDLDIGTEPYFENVVSFIENLIELESTIAAQLTTENFNRFTASNSYNDKVDIVDNSFNISNLNEDELIFLLKGLKEMANNSK